MLKVPITAIILAGGQSARMNGDDKGLLLLKNKPLYRHVIDKVKPLVDNIIISSNRNRELYNQSNYPVVSDLLSGFLGPLAGIHSGLIHSKTQWNLIVSCDTPFLPDDLVIRLQHSITTHCASYVFDGEKDHPTILLINRDIAEKIEQYLLNGDRKLLLFLNSINAVRVDFSDEKQAFININTPEELNYWNQIL